MKTTEGKAKTSRKVNRPGAGLLKNEAQIAKQLGESPVTVRNWRYTGVIPWISTGPHSVRYRLVDVMEALSKRTIKPRK